MKITHLTLENGTQHYYSQGDIMEGDLKQFLDNIPLKADVVYSDPPWNDGNCKYWRTMANKQDENIKSYKLSYIDFLNCLNVQLPFTSSIYVEGSKHTYNSLENVFKSSYPYSKVFKIFYNKCIEQRLLVCSNQPIKKNYNNLYDLEYVKKALDNKLYNTVLDPCVGLGTTAKISYELNKNFIGFDLNKTRLNQTINLFNNYIIDKKEYKI